MSLFGDIARAFGHTVESLAQDIGADVSALENVINDLASQGVDIFSAAARLNLDAVYFLRGIVNLLGSDPHQELTWKLTAPFQALEDPLYQLSQQWTQMADLHNNTAQAVNKHINDLFQNSGTGTYSGTAADTLWDTNQYCQQYFTTVVIPHAQVQQTRHSNLNGSVNEYLVQMPGRVNSLSEPMAAFSLLSVNIASENGVSSGGGTSVLDNPTVQWIEQQIEEALQDAENGPPPSDPDSWPLWLIILVVVVILFIIGVIVAVVILIANALQNHQTQQNNTTTPTPTPIPTSTPTPVITNLTPAQQRLFDDVKTRLGSFPYNDADIEDLIRAGYTDPTVIAAIIKSGNIAAFLDPDVVKLMNELTKGQQLRVVALVNAHPGLTPAQLRNFLRYIKMKCTYNDLINDIQGNNPSDPVAQEIAKKYPNQVQDLINRLNSKVGNNLNSVSDPFAVADGKLSGWYDNITGGWGEWATIEQYYEEGKLVDFSVPLSPDGEVDIKINDGGVEKWVEMKNAQSIKNVWSKALNQAANYADHGATDIVIDFLQQDGASGPGPQQLRVLEDLRRRYPAVKFEVNYGSPDPARPIPFDPPSNNWGKCLP